MACKPAIEPLEGALAEREGRVLRVLDLRHRGAPDPGEDAQLRAVKLTMRKLRAEEQQGGDCGGGANRFAVGDFQVWRWSSFGHSDDSFGWPYCVFYRTVRQRSTDSHFARERARKTVVTGAHSGFSPL